MLLALLFADLPSRSFKTKHPNTSRHGNIHCQAACETSGGGGGGEFFSQLAASRRPSAFPFRRSLLESATRRLCLTETRLSMAKAPHRCSARKSGSTHASPSQTSQERSSLVFTATQKLAIPERTGSAKKTEKKRVLLGPCFKKIAQNSGTQNARFASQAHLGGRGGVPLVLPCRKLPCTLQRFCNSLQRTRYGNSFPRAM